MFHSVEHAVLWGLAPREFKDIQAIGVDEIAWRKGRSYLTLVYRTDKNMRRLLWVAQDRTEQSLRAFFEFLSDEVGSDSVYGHRHVQGVPQRDR